MIKPAPAPTRGIAGVALLFCVVAAGAGLAFDLMGDPGARFSVAAQPGGRAVLGIGVAAVIVLAAHAMRLVLGRRPSANDEGGADAGDHA